MAAKVIEFYKSEVVLGAVWDYFSVAAAPHDQATAYICHLTRVLECFCYYEWTDNKSEFTC